MKKILPALLFAPLFATAFYESAFGINVLIIDLALVVALVVTRSKFFEKLNWVKTFVLMSWLATAVFVTLYASNIAIGIHFIFTAIFCGYVTSSYWVQPLWAFWSGLVSMCTGLIHFRKVEIKTGKRKKMNLKSLGIYVVPFVIAMVFFTLYTRASSSFAKNMQQFAAYLSDIFSWLPNIFNLKFILLFLLGLSIVFGFLFPKLKALILSADIHKKMNLQRTKTRMNRFKNMDLQKEYKAQLFMFLLLNLLLVMLNVDDLLNVWLGFSFDGQFLKEYVHNGTYMLLLSIVLSIVLVLFAFRRNLNFYKSPWLKTLSYIWLAQNAFLVLSVLLRNWHYVTYFNLAYLRIGLFFFLSFVFVLLCLIGVMIYRTKTRYYLLKHSSFVAMALLLMISSVDWDKTICTYNFDHAGKAFLHRSWLMNRDEKCLPILLENKEKMVNGVDNEIHQYYIETTYNERINEKIALFNEDFEQRNYWEWNYADWKAYQALKP